MPLESENHVVHGRRRHLEVALKVDFRWRATVQFDVRRDERQVLTLQLRERVPQEWLLSMDQIVSPSNALVLTRGAALVSQPL